MATKKAPTNAPPLMGDPRLMDPIWIAFVDNLVAEIERLKARLAAAGIA